MVGSVFSTHYQPLTTFTKLISKYNLDFSVILSYNHN